MPLTKVTGKGISDLDELGVGTSSPRSVSNYSFLTINNSSGAAIDFELGEALKTTMTQSSGQFEINTSANLPQVFKTNNSERMRLTSAGDLLFNTTSTTVGGNSSATTAIRFDRSGTVLQCASQSNPTAIFNRTNNDGDVVVFQRSGTQVGSVKVFSNNTQYLTTSDGRLKENIKPISDGVEKLMAMNPVTYTWKATPDEPSEQGFIAQDMQDIAPEAVSLTDGQEMMGMDYGRITPIIVSALQDALQRISKLEQKISELENG